MSTLTPGTSGTSGLQSSLAKNDSELSVVSYVYQSPITLSNIAEATRDDPGEEIIKTEIKANQLETTIAPPMATSSTQVLPQSVMQSSPKKTSNEGEEPSATPEIVPKQCEKVQIHDQSPGQAVQTIDGQLQTSSEEQVQQQQPKEVTQLESIIAPSMETSELLVVGYVRGQAKATGYLRAKCKK